MAGSKIPPAPKGAAAGGKALWSDITGRFELDARELALLREAVRCVDDLDALAAVVAREGRMTASGKVHPALIESRQARLVLAKTLACLRIPELAADDTPLPFERRRAQRRGGARGPQRIGA